MGFPWFPMVFPCFFSMVFPYIFPTKPPPPEAFRSPTTGTAPVAAGLRQCGETADSGGGRPGAMGSHGDL